MSSSEHGVCKMTEKSPLQICRPAGKCCNHAALLQLQPKQFWWWIAVNVMATCAGFNPGDAKRIAHRCCMKICLKWRLKILFMWIFIFTAQLEWSVIWAEIFPPPPVCHHLLHANWVWLQPEAKHWPPINQMCLRETWQLWGLRAHVKILRSNQHINLKPQTSNLYLWFSVNLTSMSPSPWLHHTAQWPFSDTLKLQHNLGCTRLTGDRCWDSDGGRTVSLSSHLSSIHPKRIDFLSVRH